jgi:hypothetical protein
MLNKYIISGFFIMLIYLIYLIYYLYKSNNIIDTDANTYKIVDPNEIPFLIICWNNLTFVRNFINQIKKYPNKIILLDNNSTFEPIKEYYKEIKSELGDKIDIRLLKENYGHEVYLKLEDTLPKMYFLSDPDLELNKNFPDNFAEVLYDIAMKFDAYKIGLAIDISDTDYYNRKLPIKYWEGAYWTKTIEYKNYELYEAPTDTTFCLVNRYKPNSMQIRIAGDFTVKHLPWYKDYIKKHFSEAELNHWKKNNKSSTILKYL